MTENGKRKVVRIDPAVAEKLRKINADIKRESSEGKRLEEALEKIKTARKKLDHRDVYIDDMPGKQIPFKYQINIPLIGGSSSPVTGTFNVSFDGPFVCRRIFASVLITNAPSLTFQFLPNPEAVYDYTHFIGRYAPVSGSGHYLIDPENAVPFASRPGQARGYALPTGVPIREVHFIAPPLDFQWEYNDSAGKVTRQDKPISGDVFARHDDDGYLMNNEVFSAGSTVNFIVSPTRPITIISRTDSNSNETESGPIDVELQVTFDGFKLLQPLEL